MQIGLPSRFLFPVPVRSFINLIVENECSGEHAPVSRQRPLPQYVFVLHWLELATSHLCSPCPMSFAGNDLLRGVPVKAPRPWVYPAASFPCRLSQKQASTARLVGLWTWHRNTVLCVLVEYSVNGVHSVRKIDGKNELICPFSCPVINKCAAMIR